MSWEIHPARATFSKYAEDWDRLNAEFYDGHPCFDSRFVGPLLDYFGNGKEQLCIHRSNGVISGALILQPDGMGRWSSFRPSQSQVTPLLFSDASLLDALLKTLPGFAWTIEFCAVDPRYSPDFSRFESVQIISAHDHTIFRSESFAAAFSVLETMRRILRSAAYRRASSDDALQTANVKTCLSIEGLSAEQYDLQEFTARDNIEVSIDWFELLQENVYPNDPGVRYYFVAEKKIPSTIVPLRLTTKGRVRTIEALGNYYTSLYTPLQTSDSDPLSVRHLLASATRDHGGAHVMRFAPMDSESPAYKGLLNELRAIGWIPFKFFCFGNWFLKVDFNWEGYLKKRSANLRSTIKRMTKKFAAESGTLEVLTATEEIEQSISAFQEVYMASWKIPEPYPDFVPSLIRLLASNGMLRLGIARLQGRPVAAQLWIVGQEKASIYKVAYHEDFASYSPGTVLTSYLLQYVIEQDHVKEVDFLIGDDKYKQIWMSDRRERWGIVAYNPRTIIGCALFIKEVVGRLAKSVTGKIKIIFLKTKLRCTSSNKS